MKDDAPLIAEGLVSYQIGGSERIGVDVAKELRRRGYRVLCFSFYDSNGPMRAELEQAGIRCLDVNYQTYRGWYKRVTYQWRLTRILRAERVQALHVHHATALILCGIPARLAGVKRLVMSEHGLHQLKDNRRYRRSAAFYCQFATSITAVEPGQVQYFHNELGVPARKLHYVPNGVRLPTRTAQRVTQARQALGLQDGSFAFFFVGRLAPEKDLGTLIEAFAQLPSEVAERSRLYLAGDGDQRASLVAHCAALNLDNRVTFLGARSDVPDLLMAADAFVMSSRTEGLPMAMLEAMAAGVPCVATAVGGIPELLANDRGLCVPPANPTLLAAAMAQLAGSPQLREKLVANAMATLRSRFDLDAVVDEYLRLLGLPPHAS